MMLETDRLLLREMTQEDFDSLCKILQDKDVMYAYEHAFSQEEAQAWLNRQIQRYQTDGFGLWAVVLKDCMEMIGQCGLTWQDYNDQKVMEIGYLFQKAFWKQGFAIEAAMACKKHAFETLKQNEVYSIIRDNNLPSQKVAIKNGMTVIGSLNKYYYGMNMPHLVFCARREN